MVIEIEKEVLQTVFDVAVQSMDFGSGMLDDEDVRALRKVAVLIGVDPMEGTPTSYSVRMHHVYKPGKPSAYDVRFSYTTKTNISTPRCKWCRKFDDDPIHSGTELFDPPERGSGE